MQFDAKNHLLSQFELNVGENQGTIPAVCQIPGCKVFYYGGYDPHLDSGYIINLQDHNIELLPKLRGISYTHATYFNGEVYIFTGYPATAKCDKFNLSKRTWSNLADFPGGSAYGVSVLPCKEFFILSSNSGTNLYTFNSILNSYNLLTAGVTNASYNLLFRDGNKYYYLSDTIYFVSNQDSLNIWIKAAKGLSGTIRCVTSKPITRKRNFYFVSSHYKIIFKFDLDTEVLSRVLTY